MASVEILGCSEPWVYGTLGSHCTLGSSDSIGTLGSSDSSDPIGTLGPSENPPPSPSSFKWRLGGGGGGERGRVRSLVASRMLVQIFLESYGTVAAVSAQLVMHVSSSSYHILTRVSIASMHYLLSAPSGLGSITGWPCSPRLQGSPPCSLSHSTMWVVSTF